MKAKRTKKSTPREVKVIPVYPLMPPSVPSGYGEVLDDTLPMSEDQRKDEDCDWDDNPDQSLCDDERIESERARE